MTETLIQVQDLKKYFEQNINNQHVQTKAVDGISFNVKKGEIFGLLGPNGAGKTTTIKLLLGLLEPNEGSINIFGMNPQREDVKIKEHIGYVAEEPLIFRSLTTKDLFNFISSIRKLNPSKTQKMLREYLESFEAIQYYEQILDTLSHGNKQKMQIIASIIHNPKILILDEPLAGLDAKSVKVFKEILDMHIENGGAVLFSTHIMKIAEELCDRIGIISKGKMVGIGTIDELRKQSNKLGASLEDVFLRLTDQDISVMEIIKKLRESFNNK
ncbi:MAG: ABC transporter ATP-binding protein [Candidatus Lokiarchaeota archaeon]|nr:ABC transporter ATP-binding protein [Candidatus Lokiarchaeota archaeon]